MLEGVKVRSLEKFPDERGSFTEIFRADWDDFFEDQKPMQANLSISYPGMIRGWHQHVRGQVDYFVVVKGSILVCTFDEATGEFNEIPLSAEKMQIARVPGKNWHGTKTVGNEPSVTVYYVSKLYDYKNPDEGRRDWKDNIIVKSINGKTNDARVGKIWDWFAPAHK